MVEVGGFSFPFFPSQSNILMAAIKFFDFTCMHIDVVPLPSFEIVDGGIVLF